MWIGLKGCGRTRMPIWVRKCDQKNMFRNWMRGFPKMNQTPRDQCGMVSYDNIRA